MCRYVPDAALLIHSPVNFVSLFLCCFFLFCFSLNIKFGYPNALYDIIIVEISKNDLLPPIRNLVATRIGCFFILSIVVAISTLIGDLYTCPLFSEMYHVHSNCKLLVCSSA